MTRSRRACAERRLRLALAGLGLVVIVLGGRLIQVQGIEGPRYARMAERQRLHEVTLTALRGSILDRNGQQLAESVAARDIYADPAAIREAMQNEARVAASLRISSGSSTANLPATIAAQLAPVLHMRAKRLLPRLTGPGTFAYLVRGVPTAVGDAVDAMHLPGIGVLDSVRRLYPNGSLAASILGFVGVDGHGLAGLEYADDALLAGTDGRQIVEIGANGSVIPDTRVVEFPARPGSTLQLTLDRAIQWEAQQAITTQVQRTGASTGTVIVMNPRTGEILALATAPGYDPNRPLAGESFADPAVSDVYEPGSVNKIITMSAALQENVDTPLTPITIPPDITVDGSVFHDAEVHGTERLTLTGVLAISSNIGAIEVAEGLGAPTLYHFLQTYGFGRLTGSGLPGESAGLLPPLAQWSGTTLPTVAFGQGIAVTALQVASVYATIANGGVRIAPHVVKEIVSASGRVTVPASPPSQRVISPTVARELSNMLEAVTTDQGTAPAAQITGYRVAGKTGTANRPNGQGGYAGYTASFVGFAPADRPQLLVEVVLQQPLRGHFGGAVAAPVFHDVMSFALQELHIPPTFTAPPVAQITAP